MAQPLFFFFALVSTKKGDFSMNDQVGFEYRSSGKENETAFEIFLKYTDEKEKSAAILGKILARLIVKQGMALLDVGSGNGEYLRLALCGVRSIKKTFFTLLEPSSDLVKRLRLKAKRFPRNAVVKVVRSTFENFTTKNRFDVVLASHAPLAKNRIENLTAVYRKMLGLLKPEGCLIVVLRGKDDVHGFRTVFKSRLIGRDYQSLTIDDATEALRKIAGEARLRVSRFSANAKLRLPYPHNMRDVISIAEFLLNKKWKDFPGDIREAVLHYVKQKKGILHQIDGFALVRKI
jgi:SAM-dependent methyltransferase